MTQDGQGQKEVSHWVRGPGFGHPWPQWPSWWVAEASTELHQFV